MALSVTVFVLPAPLTVTLPALSPPSVASDSPLVVSLKATVMPLICRYSVLSVTLLTVSVRPQVQYFSNGVITITTDGSSYSIEKEH